MGEAAIDPTEKQICLSFCLCGDPNNTEGSLLQAVTLVSLTCCPIFSHDCARQ